MKFNLFITILLIFIIIDLIYFLIKSNANKDNFFKKLIEGVMLALMTLVENFINNGEAKKAVVCNLILFIYQFIGTYFKIKIPTYDEIAIIMEKVYNIYKDGIKNNNIQKDIKNIEEA